MAFDADYYNHLQLAYKQRRDVMAAALTRRRLHFMLPEGAYYILADFSSLDRSRDDREFAVWLAETVGVATVPGSSFYGDRDLGRTLVRFAFCKKFETLGRAAERLVRIGDFL